MSKSKTYIWQWKDSEGKWVGWNYTVTTSKALARKEAKKMESPARDFTYEILVNGKVEETTGHNTGMYLD